MAKIQFACYANSSLKISFDEGSAERRLDEVEHETRVPGNIPLSDRARQAIEFSVTEAKRLGSEEVTPEHLLLGLIREQRAWPAKLPSYARVRKMLTTCSVVRMNHLIAVDEPRRRDWRRRPATRAKGWLFRLLEVIQNDLF